MGIRVAADDLPDELRIVPADDLPDELTPQVDVRLDYGQGGPEPSSAAQWTSAIARPVLEGMGAVGGGLLAGGSTLGLGTLAGGGLGFAAGRAAANTIDEALGIRKPEPIGRALSQVPSDVAEGFMYEAAGPVVGKAIGAVGTGWRNLKGFLTGTGEGVTSKAAKEIASKTTRGPAYDLAEEEAKKIKETTGAEFTRGEMRGDPAAIAFERSKTAEGGKFGAAKVEQRLQVGKALRGEFEKAMGRPTTTAMDRGAQIQEGLRGEKEAARKMVSKLYDEIPGDVDVNIEQLASAVKNLKTVGNTLIPDYERQHTVSPIIEELGTKIKKMRKVVEDAPDFGPDLLDIVIDEGGIRAKSTIKPGEVGSGMYDAIEDVPRWVFRKDGRDLDDLRESLNSRGFSFDTVDELKDALRGAAQDRAAASPVGDLTTDFQSLRNLRSQTLAAIRDAEARGDQTIKTGKLKQLKQSIEETIDQMATQGENPAAAEAYRKASAAYRDYSQKFKQGAVAQVLRKGPLGEESRMAPEKVARMLTSPGNVSAIEQLKVASKSPKVWKAVNEEIADRFLTYADDGRGGLSPAKVGTWFRKNQEVINRLYGNDPKKLAALKTVQRGFEIANRSNMAITAGSDTAEKLGPVLAGELGARMAGKLGGRWVAWPVFREVYKMLGKNNAAAVDKLILQATFDPDLAQALISAKLPSQNLERKLRERLTQHLTTFGAASSSPTK